MMPHVRNSVGHGALFVTSLWDWEERFKFARDKKNNCKLIVWVKYEKAKGTARFSSSV